MILRVALEVAPKKTFASALDWPGWARSGRTEDDALAVLLAYADRYAAVARRARVRFAAPKPSEVEIVERVEGGSGTEFGVPGVAASGEDEPVSAKDLDRLVSLLRGAWSTFDDAVIAARGKTLTVGPRGGGRNLEKMTGHVRDAEAAYVGQLGSRPAGDADLDALREGFVATLTARVRGEPLPNPRNTKKPWSPRYAVRRSAWHSLDHAWELEDRS